MAWQPVPINQPVYSNIDGVSLTNRSPNRYNTYRNSAGHTSRRPGYETFVDLSTSAKVDGLHSWDSQNVVIGVSSEDVFSISSSGTATTLGTGLFESDAKVTWADFGDTLYAANGDEIVKVTTSTASALTDADIPVGVSHVAAFDTYLLANRGGTGQMHFSDVLTPEVWSGDYVTAEQSPDDLVAVHSRWSEIWLFGAKTVEVWYNDGVAPFVPFSGGVISTGCIASATIQYARDAYYWVNDKREVVRSGGQAYQIISDPITNLLREANTISDATGDYITVGGEDWYVLSLPSYGDYGITLVYDIRQNEWQGEWNFFDASELKTTRYRSRQFKMQCSAFMSQWNKHLIGDTTTGKIFSMSKSLYSDAGETIKAVWYTGSVDHGTNLKKRSYRLRLRVQRGEGVLSSNPKFMLRWRDDGSKVWSNTIEMDLGEAGEYEFYVSARRLGIYRSRQYELSVTDDVPFVITTAEEDIEVLPR